MAGQNSRMHQEAADAIFCCRELRIVKIVHMNGYAVCPGGKARRSFESRPDHRGLSAAHAKMLEMLAANYARSRQRSGESKIQSIKDRLFSKFDDLRRDIFVSRSEEHTSELQSPY